MFHTNNAINMCFAILIVVRVAQSGDQPSSLSMVTSFKTTICSESPKRRLGRDLVAKETDRGLHLHVCRQILATE